MKAHSKLLMTIVMVTLAMLAAFNFNAIAGDPTSRFSSTARSRIQSCLLTSVAENLPAQLTSIFGIDPNASAEAFFTTLDQLGTTIYMLSQNPEEAARAIEALNKVLQNKELRRIPMFEEVIRDLAKNLNPKFESKVLTCVVRTEDCAVDASTAGAMATQKLSGMGTAPLFQGSKVHGQEISAVLLGNQLHEVSSEWTAMSFRTINNKHMQTFGEAADEIRFPINFLHEYRHFLDFQLIADWINANQKLILAGQAPDDFFRRYVRWYEGTIVIDSSFRRLFLESRGYGMTMITAHASGHSDIAQGASKNLLQEVREANPAVVAEVLPDLKNIYTWGAKTGDEMKASIHRAEKILEPKMGQSQEQVEKPDGG